VLSAAGVGSSVAASLSVTLLADVVLSELSWSEGTGAGLALLSDMSGGAASLDRRAGLAARCGDWSTVAQSSIVASGLLAMAGLQPSPFPSSILSSPCARNPSIPSPPPLEKAPKSAQPVSPDEVLCGAWPQGLEVSMATGAVLVGAVIVSQAS